MREKCLFLVTPLLKSLLDMLRFFSSLRWTGRGANGHRTKAITSARRFSSDSGVLAGVHMVTTVEEARRVVSIINKLPPSTYHAWDTEVADINVQEQSPVGNGRVICASFYSGPGINYGNGERVWIENTGDSDVSCHSVE